MEAQDSGSHDPPVCQTLGCVCANVCVCVCVCVCVEGGEGEGGGGERYTLDRRDSRGHIPRPSIMEELVLERSCQYSDVF